MTPIADLVNGLRRDARNYGRMKGHGLPVEPGETLVWDQSNVRAWEAAALIETLALLSTIDQAPTEGVSS